MSPRAVTKKDEARLWKFQYPTRQYAKTSTRRYAFRKGDTVRISHVRQPFDREYDERLTMEYFVVDDRGMKEGISYYTLKDTSGDVVQGTFYQSEFNRVKVTEQTVYRIEKVIRRRRNDALVKWMG
jgi:transcription termination factor Rho